MSNSDDVKSPSLCHHAASGRAVVRLNGKDHYCGAWDTRTDRPTPDARAVYQRLIAEWLAGADVDVIETIAELVAAFWATIQKAKSRLRQHDYRAAMRYLMLYGDLPITEFGPLKLKAVRQAMIRDGLARKTINGRIGCIQQAISWAAESELIDPLHPHRLAVVKPLRKGQGGKEPTRRRPVEWEQVAAIEPHVPPVIWAMVQLQWHTGMRSSEICIMRGADIDTSGDVWLYRPAAHKTDHLDGHVRVVAIGSAGQDVLRPWLREDPDEYLFQPREAEDRRNRQRRENRETPRWASHDPDRRRRRRRRTQKRSTRSGSRRPREQYTQETYRRAIKRAITAAGVDDWHPHQLRHAFATRARAAFDEWDPVRAALGHTSPQTTITYARLDERKAIEVASRIG